MKTLVKVIGFLLLSIAFSTSLPSSSSAQQETCKKCEFIKCIKNTIKQKEALKAGYEALARKWEKLWVNSDVTPPVPLNSIDIEKLDQSSRIPTFAMLKTQFIMLRNQEEEMASQIGPPQGCGYDPSKSYEMSTDSIFCNINQQLSTQAQQGAPCKELYEIALRHEALHMTHCQERKGNKALPTVVLTPAGKAREESEAYTQEIAELKQLLKDMGGTFLEIGGRSEMTLPFLGTVVFQMKGRADFTVSDDPAQSISGSGEYSVSADASHSNCRISGFDRTYPMVMGGNRSGDTMNFKFIPSGTQVIPSFRITCARGFGFSIPVPRMTGEYSFPAEDGQKATIDLTALTQGHVKGENTLTLHMCKEDKDK